MPNMKVLDMAGKEVGEITLSDAVFGAEVNSAVLHIAVKSYLANQRQGTQSTKTRSEVSGGGKKPWKQKGTGHARQGSTRSPQWTHGGIALGPKPRSYRFEINKKVKRIALQSAFSSKVADGDMIVVDNIATAEYKTKTMVNMLKALNVDNRALVVLDAVNPFAVKSCANIERVETTLATTINVYEIMKADKMVITAAAVKKLEEVYCIV